MTSIKQFYLVPTKYGVNLLAETHSGDFYQQVHHTLCYDGGGSAEWEQLDKDMNNQPIIKNKKDEKDK